MDRSYNFNDPLYDNWFDFIGHEQDDKGENLMYNADCEQADKVASALREIKRHEAATFIQYRAYNLDSFVDSPRLLGMFDWNEASHGYKFWEECYHELVSVGFEEMADLKDVKPKVKAKAARIEKARIGKKSRSRKKKAA